MAYPGEELQAPGILANPVLVEALYDPQAAHEAALRNLLQRRGYQDLDAVRKEGREELVLRQLQRITGQLPEASRQQIGQLGHDGLAELSEALLDFRQLSDLTAWLERDR